MLRVAIKLLTLIVIMFAFMLSVTVKFIMLTVIMLSVTIKFIMLPVIMLSFGQWGFNEADTFKSCSTLIY